MKLHLLFTFLSVAIVVSHAGLPSVVNYWNSMLPQTPITKVVEELLHNEWTEEDQLLPPVYIDPTPNFFPFLYDATEDQIRDYANISIFFTEKELNPGSTMNSPFLKSTSTGTTGSPPTVLLPRLVSKSIPFSTNKIQEIYDKLSVAPDSKEARIMKMTIEDCEKPSMKGGQKFCATSLESMIDFTISILGKHIIAISTEIENETPAQKYTVVGRVLTNEAAVVICHKVNYAYAVFYCHTIQATNAFQVSLVGSEGTEVKALAVCHKDTSEWNPKHLAFYLLDIKPGTTNPVCHFLPQHHIAWVTTN